MTELPNRKLPQLVFPFVTNAAVPCSFQTPDLELSQTLASLDVSGNLLAMLAAFLLVLLNGFFVAAEFGLVKLRQTRVRAMAKAHGWRGRILKRVHSQVDEYLSACQLGITFASLALGWIGEPAFAEVLRPIFAAFGIQAAQLIHTASFLVAFGTISFLHIVVGELAPKSLAIRVPESVAVWTAVPLYLFYWGMYPAIWILNHSSNFVLKVVGLRNQESHDPHYSVEELKFILRNSRALEKFTRDEWSVLAQTLDFSDYQVADLMRPFSEVITLSASNSLQENMRIIRQHRYSRYPFLDATGNVLGVIHLKDLFLVEPAAESAFDLRYLMRPVLRVAPVTPAIELFRKFRGGAPHFAVVGHLSGPPIGFLTIDNLLSTLVGDIRDEFRLNENDWAKLQDGSIECKGSLPIATLERALGIEIEGQYARSVGGLILWKVGDFPKEGDKIEFGQFDILVAKMNGPRIIRLRVHPRSPDLAPTL